MPAKELWPVGTKNIWGSPGLPGTNMFTVDPLGPVSCGVASLWKGIASHRRHQVPSDCCLWSLTTKCTPQILCCVLWSLFFFFQTKCWGAHCWPAGYFSHVVGVTGLQNFVPKLNECECQGAGFPSSLKTSTVNSCLPVSGLNAWLVYSNFYFFRAGSVNPRYLIFLLCQLYYICHEYIWFWMAQKWDISIDFKQKEYRRC